MKAVSGGHLIVKKVIVAMMIFIFGLVLLVAYDSKFWRYYLYQGKAQFYFEKFKNADEAESALNQEYPPGSAKINLVEALSDAGVVRPTGDLMGSPDTYWYHSNTDSFLFEKAWRVIVWFDKDNKIKKLEVKSYFNHK